MADYSWLWRRPGHRPLVVAHRGASALAPENTLAAVRLALAHGAPAVECDVHLCADGVPVVIHDDRVDRTTSGKGLVSALTLQHLKTLDAGSWFGPAFAGERIPTLDEVLEACAGRARVFVELKAGGGAALVQAALAALARAPAEAAIISFDPEIVRLVAAQAPDVPLGLLVSRQRAVARGAAGMAADARALGAGFLAPHFAGASRHAIEAAHGAGLPVSVWTVDDPPTMRALAAAGVDALTTNRPDVALSCLDAC
jgi:glycerophosphoryl diester phosphodiesterase